MKNKLKEVREKSGMSQEALAEKSGVSRTTISLLEGGKAVVTKTNTLTKLSDALEGKVSDIFFSA